MIISLELNELNFEVVKMYASVGRLPNFSTLFDKYGYLITTSEEKFENLEPWIQWVTVHTGLNFADHKIFRLGDIRNSNIDQIWDILERKGVKCGAVSPMNASNRLCADTFFVPDPWTGGKVSGGLILTEFYKAVSQVVNDNASSRVRYRSLFFLSLGFLRYSSIKNYLKYLYYIKNYKKKPWYKALFLDLLLTDLFINLQHKYHPDYSSLFLNAAAHVQHHYMFSSIFYNGLNKNPDWYVSKGEDPIYDVYSLYDYILGHIISSFPQSRLQIITGLHQEEHRAITYYYRLKEHQKFLEELNLSFSFVEPRMSRDFLINFENKESMMEAAECLESITANDGSSLFKCDLREGSIFVELIYDKYIDEHFKYNYKGKEYTNLYKKVVFVAIKNGQHNMQGYFMDTANTVSEKSYIPLSSVFHRVIEAF